MAAIILIWVGFWAFFAISEVHMRRRGRRVELGVKDWRTAGLLLGQAAVVVAAWVDLVPDVYALLAVAIPPLTVIYLTVITMRARHSPDS